MSDTASWASRPSVTGLLRSEGLRYPDYRRDRLPAPRRQLAGSSPCCCSRLTFAMFGLLLGEKAGARIYNIVHTSPSRWRSPASGGNRRVVAASLAAIWIAWRRHGSGGGHGLKYPSSFRATHLGVMGKNRKAADVAHAGQDITRRTRLDRLPAGRDERRRSAHRQRGRPERRGQGPLALQAFDRLALLKAVEIEVLDELEQAIRAGTSARPRGSACGPWRTPIAASRWSGRIATGSSTVATSPAIPNLRKRAGSRPSHCSRN